MIADEKIKNSSELEFAVFCIENVAAKLGVDAERIYQAFTEQSDILNGYIVPEYEVLHTQSREYIVGFGSFQLRCRLRAWLLCHAAV